MMYTMMTWSVENVLKGSKRMNNLCMTKKKLALNLLSPVILSSYDYILIDFWKNVAEKLCCFHGMKGWAPRMGKSTQISVLVCFR